MKPDKKPAKEAAKTPAIADRGEAIGLMEPMLVGQGSRHRAALTDLAVELAGRAAGFRRSLPEGVLTALADLVRAMNCYYSNLIEGHDTHPIDIERALKDTFRPEFLNRIDEIIIFSTLSMEQMEQIVDLQMVKVSSRLAEHGLNVQLSPSARSWLAEEGYDPAFGARPLQRALQKYVESPLSVKILRGEFQEGDTIIVDHLDDEGLVFRKPEGSTPVEIEEEVSA